MLHCLELIILEWDIVIEVEAEAKVKDEACALRRIELMQICHPE